MGWLFGKKKDPAQEPTGSHTLPDFVRGIQHAVNSAMLMAEHNTAGFVDRHMNKDGTPRTETISIPGSELVIVVPTITTSHPPTMALDEMEVRMSVTIQKTEMKSSEPGEDGTARTSFQVSLAPSKPETQGNVIDIVMKFKRGDPPEGVSRIIENMVQTIHPTPKKI